jgi:hypothetical protein
MTAIGMISLQRLSLLDYSPFMSRHKRHYPPCHNRIHFHPLVLDKRRLGCFLHSPQTPHWYRHLCLCRGTTKHIHSMWTSFVEAVDIENMAVLQPSADASLLSARLPLSLWRSLE